MHHSLLHWLLLLRLAGLSSAYTYSIVTMANSTDVGSCIKFCANNTEDQNVIGSSTDYRNSVITHYISPVHRIIFTVIIVFFAILILDAIRTVKFKYWNKLYTVELFFVRHLLVSDIIAVVINNGFVCAITLWSIVFPCFKGVPCTIASMAYIPYCANSLFVMLACFDRLCFVAKKEIYVEIMDKKKNRYGIVLGVWALSALSLIPIFMDPELQATTVTGVCKYRPFSSTFGILFLVLPSILSAVVVVVLCTCVYRIAYKSNSAEEKRQRKSGASANEPKPEKLSRSDRIIHVLCSTRKGAVTSLLLGGSHLLFGGIFAIVEFMIFPLFGGVTYEVLKYIVALYFGFLNIFTHSFLHGYHMKRIRENMRICGKPARKIHPMSCGQK